jgi:hypothetical protein
MKEVMKFQEQMKDKKLDISEFKRKYENQVR